MFTGDLTSEQGKQDYENYIMNNVRNEINSYTKQSQINNASSSVSGASGSLTSSVILPSGVIVPFAGGPGVTPNPGTLQGVPDGWLLCSGVAVSRTAYSALFIVVGTTYGVGDGSTTFNVPDLRGRAPYGKDNMDGTTASRITAGVSAITGTTLGAVGGSEALHTHTHTQNSHNHTQDAHNHYYASGPAGGVHPTIGQNGNNGPIYGPTGSTTATNQAQTATNQNAGTGSSQNMSPTIITNYIIKT